ncbi:MAG: hypothetical protein OEZ55_14480 [Nitrospinota bacterium]|nr:hypothetical protein [Nitrospinota bacterium]
MRSEAKFISDVLTELERARVNFPSNRHMNAALVEEVGELSRALLECSIDKSHAENVYKEAVQVAVMAARVALEGDPSFDYDPEEGMKEEGQ